MKKSTLYTTIISLLLAVFLFSCEQPKNEVPVQQYTTPTIVGRITLPNGSTVNPSDIYVKVVDEGGKTAKVDKVKSDKTFVIQGLKEGSKYSILFTSEEPEFNNRSLSRDPDKSQGVGGWIHDVLPAIKEGNDIGSVKLKPLGTIKGKALIDKAEEHYDITVYIPGTSYIARTDVDGTFAIYNVAEGTYKLRYTLDNHMPVMVEDVILTCPEDVENPEVVVKDVKLVSSLGTVEGIAKLGDTNDSSVVSIRLESEDKSIVYTSTSSKEGTYIINNVSPGTYRVIASSSGYVSQSTQYFKVVPATITSVEENIMLFGNIGTILGNVSLSDSKVKEGIAILIKDNNSNNSFSTMTDDKGSFQKVVKPGEYKIYASYPGYVPVSYNIVVTENEEIEVSFTALLPDSGTISGLSYSPEEQVTVIASDGTPVQTIQSGLDKSYRFEKIPTGTYSVKFSKSGFASYIVNEVVVAPAGSVTVNGEALKSSFGTITGTSASEGESVSILKDGVAIDAVITSSERTYIFTGLEPGKYTIKFSKNGFSSYESSEVMVSSGSKLIINGKELVSIYGSISGKSASKGETVYLVKDGMQIASMITLENREYIFKDVVPEEYTVRFSKSGYSDYESGKLTVNAGQSYVVDGKKLVSQYGKIYGSSYSEGETVILLKDGIAINTLTTSSDRKYIFDGIEPGSYCVRFIKNGYKDYESGSFTVSAGDVCVAEGKQLIGLYGAVAGTVILPDTDDYSGVVITLKNSSAMTISLSEISATDGSFRFDNITTPGTYLLTFSKEGYVKDQSKSINVVTGSVASVENVILKSTTATVLGKVQLEGTSTYENVTVLLKNDKNQYTATTDQKGEYLINRVIPGTYSLLASKDGFVTGQISEFVVEPSIDKQMELVSLPVAIKSVTGSVELELASDYAGVLVTATNLKDNTLIYSAITNSSGNFTLAGMKSGEYAVVLSCNGYNTITLPTIDVKSTTVYTIPRQNMAIARGKIAGLVKIEGYTDYSGVNVSILGTDYKTTTDSDGSFLFNVPTGNYPGGLRFEKEDIETVAYSETIPVLVNSTYAIKNDIMMSAVNVPVVRGVVKVGGTEDWSSVTVKLIEKPEYTLVTGSDGTWRFEHVPIGKYTIEYIRENARKVTSTLNIIASPIFEVSSLTIIPDSASIEGRIILDSVTDYSGVTVRVVTSEVSKELSTTTDSTGYFYIGNLLSTGTHTVYFEKAGWNTQKVELANLEPLSLTDITANNQIILKDTTKPSLTSISINSGANATGARKVNITVNGFDSGSGIALMQYSWTNNFTASSWINYASSFDITIPDENNGTKTLRLKVKDYAGNESVIVSDSIELVNQIKSIGGQLSVNELHWVKSNNPYVITDDVIIPEGRTLVIDPGVDILFAGNYSILIRGTLSANGTESEHIVLRSSKDYMEKEYNGENFVNYDGSWGGISAGTNQLEVNKDSYSFDFISGSKMSYCDIQDIGNGIRGNIYVYNSTITTNLYAIGNQENKFTGALINSKISGSAFFGNNANIFGNEFIASDYKFKIPENAYYDSNINNYYWYSDQGYIHNFYVNENHYGYRDEQGNWHDIYFNNLWVNERFTFINNKIDGYYVHLYTWNSDSKIQFTSFENCSFRYVDEINPIVEYCTFKNNKNTIEFYNLYGIRFSNFINNTNQYLLKTNSKYTDRSTHDMRYNYWDTENTNKLNSISGSSNPNVDFFYDGIDNIDLSVINYRGYVSKPWAMAGYQGKDFCDLNARFVRQYENNEEAKVGSDIEIDLEMLTYDLIAKYRVAQSVDDLVNSNWITYYGSSSYSGGSVDYSKLDDGYLDLYIQVCTTDGSLSPIKNIRVGYDIPTISNISITDGYTISKDNKINMTINGKNAGYGFDLIAWIDDNDNDKKSWWIYTGKNEITNIIDPTKLINGNHTLKLQTRDRVGDTHEVNINFIVDRPTPIVTNLSVENPNVGPGNDLKISISATNTKHLKQMRVMMDEVVINQIDYSDNNASSISENISVESIYLKDGQHSIKVVMEDYTGNITYSDTVNVNISSNNSTAPTISNLDFENGKKFTENKIQSFTMKVSDDGGISLIDVTLDGDTNLYYFYDTKYQAAYNNIDVNVILRIPIYKNGNHSLKIKAVDFAGNTTEIERNFIVERSLPTVSLSISPNNERYYYNIYSNPNTSWIYDGGLYLDNVLLDYGFRNNGDSSDNYFSGNSVYHYQIPSGEHTLKAKFRMQSGEIVESDGYQISKAQSSSNFDYGEGKTWNADGTLMKDSYTYYLWNFDSIDSSKESVTGKSIGSINSTTNGLGGKAATVYIDNNELKMQFPNSTWTIEFWAKNENASSTSDIYLRLNNITYSQLYKRSASTDSYIYSKFYYHTIMGDVGQNSRNIYYSRDDASSWHHYAFVSDGSSMQVFVDGLMRARTDGDNQSVKTSNGIHIDMPEGAFIDELRISNRARSVDELWAYVQHCKSKKLIPQ